MLSSQDEACKFLVRSEMTSYHSVNGNSFFSNNFREEGWKGNTLVTSLNNLPQKDCFCFRVENFGYFHVACNFGNFGHVS